MTLPKRAQEVLTYWTELGPEGWYAGGAALDAEIRDRFLDDWTIAARGGYHGWQSCPNGMLAFIILTDQFSRNIHRDTGLAFATDALARAVATRAWQHKIDLHTPEPMRQFFYMPLMHSETTFDQDRCVCLMASRMPDTGAGNLLHARAHREVIRRFQRFPFRNAALGRTSSPDEVAFLQSGGYGEIVSRLSA